LAQKKRRPKEANVMIAWRQFLTSDPQVCHGQLCAKGTRVFVTNILDSLAEGASREEILASHPSLRPEHIDAAVAYAAELAREESLLPLVGLSVSTAGLTPAELRRMPREQRQAILAAAAEMAEQDYHADKELTGFEAFSEEELDDDESDSG
jgi:uncharacterized protein (DUF433 family)